MAAGYLATEGLRHYRANLYDRNTDYPGFELLQRLQYIVFWATLAVAVAGGVHWIWRKVRPEEDANVA
jgi:hypothetical protein